MMFLEFMNRTARPGIVPELVRVDGHYAIRSDDVIFALNGSEIAEYGTLEVVNEVSDNDANYTATLLEFGVNLESNVPTYGLLLILSDLEKKPEDVDVWDYFGTYARDDDEYSESFKFIELSDSGEVLSRPRGIDYWARRKELYISNRDFQAARHLDDYLVVPGNAKLVHCGVNPTWDSVILFADTVEVDGIEKLRVRTFNAEIFAFSKYQDETALLTTSGNFIAAALKSFTPTEIQSGQKVVKEYMREEAPPSLQIISFHIHSSVGIKLRPSKVYTCDLPDSSDGQTSPMLTRNEVLDALGLTGAIRDLVSRVRNLNVLTLVWRDREVAERYWVHYSFSTAPAMETSMED